MLEAGEDPRFIARRLVILASEDVGLADPAALGVAVAAAHALELVGLPEARLNLAQATIYLALAAKSNAVTTAIGAATADVREGLAGGVPPAMRDSHYPGAKRLRHGQGYRYPHDFPDGVVEQQYGPDEVLGRDYYRPTDRGAERAAGQRLAVLRSTVRGERSGAARRAAPHDDGEQ
jgi:putative ATPase